VFLEVVKHFDRVWLIKQQRLLRFVQLDMLHTVAKKMFDDQLCDLISFLRGGARSDAIRLVLRFHFRSNLLCWGDKKVFFLYHGAVIRPLGG